MFPCQIHAGSIGEPGASRSMFSIAVSAPGAATRGIAGYKRRRVRRRLTARRTLAGTGGGSVTSMQTMRPTPTPAVRSSSAAKMTERPPTSHDPSAPVEVVFAVTLRPEPP